MGCCNIIVRQGGILSPYLFTLYVNDLSEILCNVPCGLHVHNVLINLLFYADDLCVTTSGPSGIHTLLDTCLRYANANSITFKSNKSVYMVFKPARYRLFCPSMRMNDDIINPSDNVKYSTNHVYLHRPNAFGFWQMRLHLCYETLQRISNFSELA